MLPVSLDCPFLFVHLVFFNVPNVDWAQEIEQRQTKQKTKKLGMNPGSCEW
jgi:hypothetical protein